MIKYASIYLVLLTVLIGSSANPGREEQNPFWSIFIGHNDEKDTIKKFDSNATNKGSRANDSTQKPNPFWFFHMGLKDAKDPTIVKMNNNTTSTENEFHSINNIFLPKGNFQDCAKSQNIKKSALPLVELGGNFYYFGTYFKANFFKAMQFCRDHGMDLMSIESAEENTRIINYMISYVNKIDHFWTSGSDLGEEGHFVWLATGKSLNYTYWSPPQPDNAGKIENCLEIWKLGDKHYVWNDIPCTNAYNFICEVRECSEFCTN
ncbi:C-type lectin 37Da-like [Coccinella septempunctata]|uniref:C-type lectin 37Da-like n=1 Tax=Coccinella septempunctata TaxID=41139 RepID=UPI001D07FFD2|nr:C-type lectin 37Da-like [Coccinella septempunctata]